MTINSSFKEANNGGAIDCMTKKFNWLFLLATTSNKSHKRCAIQ